MVLVVNPEKVDGGLIYVEGGNRFNFNFINVDKLYVSNKTVLDIHGS